MTSPLAIIILAAGKGKRMNNPELPKVMHEVCGKPMIDYVLDLADAINPTKTVAVVGWRKELVAGHLSKRFIPPSIVIQGEQLGTGHAVVQTESVLGDFEGNLLVLSGDVPLLTESTTSSLIGYHRSTEATATILTADVTDPTGYGRIIRNADGSVKKIVEEKDASKKEREIREINSGIYLFKKSELFDPLRQLQPNNRQGEYYLTDVFESFWRNKCRVSAVKALDAFEVMGINDTEQLHRAERILMLRSHAGG